MTRRRTHLDPLRYFAPPSTALAVPGDVGVKCEQLVANGRSRAAHFSRPKGDKIMKIKEIKIEYGEVVPHPQYSYSNIRFGASYTIHIEDDADLALIAEATEKLKEFVKANIKGENGTDELPF